MFSYFNLETCKPYFVSTCKYLVWIGCKNLREVPRTQIKHSSNNRVFGPSMLCYSWVESEADFSDKKQEGSGMEVAMTLCPRILWLKMAISFTCLAFFYPLPSHFRNRELALSHFLPISIPLHILTTSQVPT